MRRIRGGAAAVEILSYPRDDAMNVDVALPSTLYAKHFSTATISTVRGDSSMTPSGETPAGNSPRRVLFASMIGTTIEFFDFYIYATAAVLVFPTLFFPTSDPTSARLQSLAT